MKNKLRAMLTSGDAPSLEKGPFFTSRLSEFRIKITEDGYQFRGTGPIQGFGQTLHESIKRFHLRAATMTPAVQENLDCLERGGTLLRMAHQPNTLAGLNVLSTAAVISAIGTSLKTKGIDLCPIFLVIDYDDANDQRFRGNSLLDWSRHALFQLPGAVPKALRRRVACAVPVPTIDLVDLWLGELRRSVKSCARVLRRANLLVPKEEETKHLLDLISSSMRNSYLESRSLTEANARIISEILNGLWGLEVMIVPATSLLPFVHGELVSLIKRANEWTRVVHSIRRDLATFGLSPSDSLSDLLHTGIWRICANCYERCAINGDISGERLLASWNCNTCGASAFREDITEYFEIVGPAGPIPAVVPRVHLCDVLEIFGYGMRVGASYAGGVEHLLVSRLIAQGLLGGVGPELIWEPSSNFADKLFGQNLRPTQLDTYEWVSNGRLPAVFYTPLVKSGTLGSDLKDRIISSNFDNVEVFPDPIYKREQLYGRK